MHPDLLKNFERMAKHGLPIINVVDPTIGGTAFTVIYIKDSKEKYNRWTSYIELTPESWKEIVEYIRGQNELPIVSSFKKFFKSVKVERKTNDETF